MHVCSEDDWLFWSDPDSIIVNPEKKLEEFLSEFLSDDSQFLISDDTKGLNAGNFFIRCTDEMKKFLGKVWEWGTTSPMRDYSPWEQRAIQEAFDANAIPGVKVVPQRWFNAYDPQFYVHGTYEEGDFMLHYPGYDLSWKLEKIRERI
jgi:hypothetical protein